MRPHNPHIPYNRENQIEESPSLSSSIPELADELSLALNKPLLLGEDLPSSS